MIVPAVVTLARKEKATFHSDGGELTLSPEVGEFDKTQRVYTAPKWLLNSRTVYLHSHVQGKPVETAEIHLTSSLLWITALAVYWPALFLGLFVWGWLIWPGALPGPALMVNPPAVTLATGQTQQFSATLNDVPEDDITWSATSGTITPSGFYSPPGKLQGGDQTATVTATRNSDKTRTATSIVILASAGKGLALYPALSHVHKSGTVKLFADGGTVDMQWPDVAPKGIYQAPAKIEQRQVVSISIVDKDQTGHIAGARIILLPEGNAASAGGVPSDRTLLMLAVVAGALGAWLASVKSFAGYIGTRTFVPSWSFFYLFRPCFGAGLALVVHLAHRMGSVGAGNSATNPTVVAFYSALVGLFSEEALQKLRDIFCTVFGVQDKRGDKMGQSGPPAPNPVITAATAFTARKEISIEGANFVANSTVLIDNLARQFKFVSDKALLLVNVDSVPAAGTDVKVRNPDGTESEAVKLKVQP